ncbi:LuxR C-terminal-related transcriptional regulator [Neobacillus mesonae]|uniref:LuxR C-terminal-related transcriptional regulator n=1 Tax=Neobacillus mesonae TaxID=1193713 RepID=UPI0020417E42|nr:LuxR C-terminal-related transcriptional regulator [Neobacillus mesonae]MCM3568108.1 LuxR C-terminal-related transcriptional regulator [Neobacillus mesonae]
MKSTILTANDFEKIIQFSARIARPAENIHLSIQYELANCFGYNETILWYADDNGNLSDPVNFQLSDKVLYEYLDEFHYHDYLHPKKNPELFRERKALRLADIVTFDQYDKSPYSRYLKSYGYYDEMVVALLSDGKFVGAIGMPQKKEHPGFSEKDCIRFQYLSDIIASVLLHERNKGINDSLLTAREKEVVELVKKGYSNQVIADKLHISINTVKKHLINIYQKYEVENRTQLVQKL